MHSDVNDVIVNSTDSSTSQPAAAAAANQRGDDDSPYTDEENSQTMTDAQLRLMDYWPRLNDDIKRVKNVDAKNQPLPLARIKKIMKLDEDVKMISAEAPLLFAKAAEIFITELTLRAWVHTEENKRRTLQRNDIAIAIMKYDQFDFLIDIVPRDEVRPPPKKESPPDTKANATTGDHIQYYLQMAQQTESVLASSNATVQTTQIQQQQQSINTAPQQIQLVQGGALMQTPNMSGQISIGSPPNILLNMQPHQQHQQIQLVQQIMTPNGEFQHVPVSAVFSLIFLLRI